MKKIIFFLIFSSFVNVLLSQVGLRVTPTDFSQHEMTITIVKANNYTAIISQKENQEIPKNLRKYFLGNVKRASDSNGLAFKNFNQTDLAFFCKIEVDLEQSTNLPVRFRLGEVQAVDQKEGKWQQFQQ